MCYCSVTVTAILALWLTHRVKHISSRFLPVQQKSPDRPAAPPPLKWCSDIYPGFLSGSVHFFVFTLLFFFRLLISSLGPGWWWDMIHDCCCCCLQFVLVSEGLWPGESGHCACVWGGAARSVRHAPLALIGCVAPEWWILANHITATGWSHRQLTCMWFYCQIMMMILSDIKKDYMLIKVGTAWPLAEQHIVNRVNLKDIRLAHRW